PPPPRGARDRPRPRGSPAGGLPRAAIHPRGIVRAIEPVEHNPQAVERPRVARLELDGALVRGLGPVELVHVIERLAQIKPGGRPAWVRRVPARLPAPRVVEATAAAR